MEVSPKHVGYVFDKVAPYLMAAVRYADGNYKLRDIQHAVFSGQWQLWLVVRDGKDFAAAGVTQVKTFPKKKVMEIIALGGRDMNDWLDLESRLMAEAKRLGCADIELLGRKGLVRKLGQRGWRTTHYVMRKTVR